MPITENQNEYSVSIFKKIKASGFRCEIDLRSEKIGYKIREWENKKVAYMIILGEKERSNDMISVRAHQKGDLGSFSLDDFVKSMEKENKPYSKR